MRQVPREPCQPEAKLVTEVVSAAGVSRFADSGAGTKMSAQL
jgi:hypothetical protein